MADIKKVIIDFEARVSGLKESIQQINSISNSTKKMAKDFGVSTSDIGKAIKLDDFNARIKVSEDLMGRTGLTTEKLSMGMKNAGFSINSAGKIVNSFGKEVQLTNRDLKNIIRGSKRFQMHLLSIMFAAMAVNRVMSKLYRSFTTTYQKANEDTEGLGKATWHLSAAWEFLKYSIMDAFLQSDLFNYLVKVVMDLVGWFNKLTPTEKSMIAIGLAVIGITSAIIGLLAQIGLAKAGFDMLNLGGLLGDVGKAETGLLSLRNIAKAGFGLFFVWQGIKGIMSGSLEGDLWKEFVGLLGTTLGGALIGSMFGPVGTAVGALLGLTLGVIISAVFSWKKQKVANDINKQMKEMGMIVEKQPMWGTKIGLDMVTTTGMSMDDLQLMNSSINGNIDWAAAMNESAASANWVTIETTGLNTGLTQTIDLSDPLIGALDKSSTSMWGLSRAVSAVNVGNSPTGLIHIIDSEGKIIALEPTFKTALESMTKVMNDLSNAISSQQSKLTSLISELDRYIKKLQEAAAAENSTKKSGGFLSSVKSVLGFKATGGNITKTGPYMLHEGEFVVPRGSPGNQYTQGETTNNSYNINLSVTANTNDPDELSRIIMEQLSEQLNRSNDSANS